MKKRFAVCLLGLFVVFLPLTIAFSVPNANSSIDAEDLMTRGYQAYNAGDWSTAVALYRKVINVPGFSTDDNWFMLVVSELYAGEYTRAVQDAERYLMLFPESSYVSYIRYHTGRAYFMLSNYANAVFHLTEFCHAYPNHELYASALFWIAESFFIQENYDSSESLYQRIIDSYPFNSKSKDAHERVEAIRWIRRNKGQLETLKKNNEETLPQKITEPPSAAESVLPVVEPVLPVQEPVLTDQQQFITTLISINAGLDSDKQKIIEWRKILSELLSKSSSGAKLQWTPAQQRLIAGMMTRNGDLDSDEKLVSDLLVRNAELSGRAQRPEEVRSLISDLQKADTLLSEKEKQIEGRQRLIVQLISSSMGLSEGSTQVEQSTQAAAINQNLSTLESQFSGAKKADNDALASDYGELLKKARLLWAYIVEQNQY